MDGNMPNKSEDSGFFKDILKEITDFGFQIADSDIIFPQHQYF